MVRPIEPLVPAKAGTQSSQNSNGEFVAGFPLSRE